MKDKTANEGGGKAKQGAKPGGSNTGATGGLKSAPANGGNGTMDKPSTKNPYPGGLA